MGLDNKQKKALDELLIAKFEKKISTFKRPHTLDNNFAAIHTIPEKQRRMYSGIHSLLGTFGQSFYEDISISIASTHLNTVEHQKKTNHYLSKDRVVKIDEIIHDLQTKKRKPNMEKEIQEILTVPNKNLVKDDNGRIVDVYIKKGNTEYFFELKTPLLNVSGIPNIKKQILKYVARENREIHAALVLPYNPYFPKPYDRHGILNVFDYGKDFLTGEDFWDLLGGKGAYKDIEDSFKKIGTKYWKKLSTKF
ncbi:MAG: TdeIII family type II restriction endonuclease [bacterium]|nr:TdeIII family type II restriction endonuclease [bacterium]